MSDQYWLGEAQLERIKPLLPAILWPTACRRRRVISGIVHVIRNALRWRDTAKAQSLSG